ncbi:MAG: hypothetical protein D6739_07835 [Nitrospirae bacterium]|nr:MAG: hypothetical protein D6739_07835 [Nitrospirota bacterium]
MTWAGLPLRIRGRGGRRAALLLRSLEESQWWPPERLATEQARRLRRFLVHVGRHHPRVAERFAAAGFQPQLVTSVRALARLPVAAPPGEGRGVGGGPDSRAWHRAVRWRVQGWWGLAPGERPPVAEVEDLVAAPRPPRGAVVRGEALREACGRGGDLGGAVPRLRVLFVPALEVDPALRREAERRLGVGVAPYLELPWTGLLAHACPEGGLHLCSDHLVVEVAAPGGRGAPGGCGELLVTDTTARRAPVIRCRTGLWGRIAEGRCLCGRGLPRLLEVGPLEAEAEVA